jgi:hypothetical protein
MIASIIGLLAILALAIGPLVWIYYWLYVLKPGDKNWLTRLYFCD